LAARIGHDYSEPFDEILRVREMLLYMDATKEQYMDYLYKTNDFCAAFGEFFIRTYGEPVFIDCMLHPEKTEEFTGRTFDQTLDDWYTDMTEMELEPREDYDSMFGY
jgi:hypothetical protein